MPSPSACGAHDPRSCRELGLITTEDAAPLAEKASAHPVATTAKPSASARMVFAEGAAVKWDPAATEVQHSKQATSKDLHQIAVEFPMAALTRPAAAPCALWTIRAILGRTFQPGPGTRCSRAWRWKAAGPVAREISIYTRTGDRGRSSLFTGERRRKDDGVFEALGDVDELNVAIGLAHHHCSHDAALAPLAARLVEVQCRLLDVGSYLATPAPTTPTPGQPVTHNCMALRGSWVMVLEGWIDEMDSALPKLTNFILPSGGLASLAMHQARAICRRAERSVVALEVDPGERVGLRAASAELPGAHVSASVYLNRLSDFLFVAARHCAHAARQPETIYQQNDTR